VTHRARRAVLALAVAAAAVAPAAARADALSVGVGVEPLHLGSGAGDLLIAGRNAAPLSFYLQGQVSQRLRLEVSAAYFHTARDRAHTPSGGSAYDFSATAAGFGAVYYLALPSPVGVYAGGRVTVALFSGNFTDAPPSAGGPKASAADVFLSPVVGSELALTRRLSVGTELQLPFAVRGDHSSRTLGGAPDVSGAHLAMNVVLFARVGVY
jgi:hypothetical protein